MMLSDVKDYIKSLGIADYVYQGDLDTKQQKSIGVYNSKHQHECTTAYGGDENMGYGIKYITLLIHWNKSIKETEKAALELFNAVKSTREVEINDAIIKWIQPIYEVQDFGKDEAGIHEMGIEASVVFE